MSSYKKMKTAIYTFFGAPGSGKTTIAADIVRDGLKNGIPVYSNVPIQGAMQISKSDLGYYALPVNEKKQCYLIIDEAIIEYSNRNFKNNLDARSNQFWHLHRHYHVKVFVFSQSYDGYDKKLRDLTQCFYVVKRSIMFPDIIKAYRITFDVDINEMTDQIEDKYKFDNFFLRLFTTKRAYGPVCWKLFDSYEAPELPSRPFKIYGAAEPVKEEVPEDKPSMTVRDA